MQARTKDVFSGIVTAAERVPALQISGSVIALCPSSIRVALPGATLYSRIRIARSPEVTNASPLQAQVVAIDGQICIASPLGPVSGIQAGAAVTRDLSDSSVTVGYELLGCALDSSGNTRLRFGEDPFSAPQLPLAMTSEIRELDRAAPFPLARRPISQTFVTGIRAIDGFCRMGCGQRLGIFAEPGVGKSSLLGAMAHASDADVIVIALIGERGREIPEFIEQNLSERGKKRTIVVFSTSDEPALARMNASLVAMTVAEYFRDLGLHVLLLVDSLTRLCRAYREIGLIAGEAPVRRGYPPSVFSRLPEFIERAGTAERGSITAMYTVLMSSDVDEDPMVEEIKSLTDGHIVLRRQLAERGQFPAIDVPNSLSRLAHALTGPEVRDAAVKIRSLLARLERDRELVLFGGTPDRELQEAFEREAEIITLLKQNLFERSTLSETESVLLSLGLPRTS